MKQHRVRIFNILLICVLVVTGCRPANLAQQSTDAPTVSVLPTTPTRVLNAPRPTPVLTEIPSSTAPASTVTVKPTASPASDILSGLLVFSFREDVGGLLLGEDGSILKSMGRYGGWVTFSEDSCVLYGVSKRSWNGTEVNIDTLDLNGNILGQTVIQISPELYSSVSAGFNFSQSLDRNWIGYVTIDDGRDSPLDPRYSKTRNIFLLKVDPADAIPRRITAHGGAPLQGPSWSPDSRSLAFSERDQNDVVQIFTLDVIANHKEQLTALDASYQGFEIWQIQYSPDGNYIGFIGENDRHQGYAGVIQVEDHALQWLQFPDPNYIPQLQFFWNQESTQLMTLLTVGPKTYTDYNGYLVAWFDVATGQILKTFPERGQKFNSISYAFPLKNLDVVGFHGAEKGQEEGGDGIGGYYRYDTKNDSLETFELPNLCCVPYLFIVPKTEFRPSACENN